MDDTTRNKETTTLRNAAGYMIKDTDRREKRSGIPMILAFIPSGASHDLGGGSMNVVPEVSVRVYQKRSSPLVENNSCSQSSQGQNTLKILSKEDSFYLKEKEFEETMCPIVKNLRLRGLCSSSQNKDDPEVAERECVGLNFKRRWVNEDKQIGFKSLRL
ncbi:hypothetical protein TNCV_2746111 [Trichonephila clavipes]|nr:hypothetical protein TNCV_2746111 [Trichonephila clavipes]